MRPKSRTKGERSSVGVSPKNQLSGFKWPSEFPDFDVIKSKNRNGISFLNSCADRGTLQGCVVTHVNHDWNLMGAGLRQCFHLLIQRGPAPFATSHFGNDLFNMPTEGGRDSMNIGGLNARSVIDLPSPCLSKKGSCHSCRIRQ